MVFRGQAEKDFEVDASSSPEMDLIISNCADIYRGFPNWVSVDDNVKTINFAKTICSELARLTTLAIGIQIDGSVRGEWLQEQIDSIYFQIRHWVEYGCAYGTIFVKPNSKGFDIFTPSDVLLVDYDNQDIRGIIFKDTYTEGKKYYTRLEYHRFVEISQDGTSRSPYIISNRAYVSKSAGSIGRPVSLAETKWVGLMEETPPILKANGEPLDGPMFGVFRTPQANSADISTPMGLPVFAEAVEELRDLDVAYSRNAKEIFDSEKIILADDRLMFDTGGNLNNRTPSVKLPHYVKNVFGNSSEEFYQEINPQLNTEVRLKGINALLSQIGYKCGFSNGYFVFDAKSGMVTATQVESDDRRTIQTVKDIRDKLEDCLNGAIYAMSVYADLYSLAPIGTYEITYDFGDITYNREEDRTRWWQYVMQGKVPAWMYFQKFEGMSEEEAKTMVEEAQPKEGPGFFQGE
ncbi:MAG: hypothetical protein ACLSX5_13905 [Lachnospiraceae bacterium]